MKRFSGHKINGAIFYLHHYIASEFSIKWYKFIVCLFVPVIRIFITINKCPPDYNTIERCNCISQHIGTIGMSCVYNFADRAVLHC